jgi:lipid-binding SYLF domain-containing protein
LSLAVISLIGLGARASFGASGDGVDEDANAALKKLYSSDPTAKLLAENSKAILVFPNIIRGGFLVGAQYGEGTLLENGQVSGHYNIVAGSFGFQAGGQTFGCAMFLMTDKAREYLDRSAGWELGAGPTIVLVNKGISKSLTTSTMKDDVYAFVFSQKGLMGGVSIQGSKITKINK